MFRGYYFKKFSEIAVDPAQWDKCLSIEAGVPHPSATDAFIDELASKVGTTVSFSLIAGEGIRQYRLVALINNTVSDLRQMFAVVDKRYCTRSEAEIPTAA